MPQECLICFDPIVGAPWKPPNKCKCKQTVHKECWDQWSKIDGVRGAPRCIICREDPLLIVYRDRDRPRVAVGVAVREVQVYGMLPRIQHGIMREIEATEGPNGEHRPCLKTFFIFFLTIMVYSIMKSMMRHLSANHLVQLPDPAPFRFRDEL
jgi:hypothetical protein